MTQAKDKKIARLQATLDETKATLNNRIGCITELEASVDHLTDELAECSRMNDRLNKQMVKEREKIATLKDVARFFRAQRDRVDAYLSATLDGIDRQKERYDAVPTTLGPSGYAEPPGPQDRRPPVQEPDAHSGDDGRDHTMYRDHEPSRGWESL